MRLKHMRSGGNRNDVIKFTSHNAQRAKQSGVGGATLESLSEEKTIELRTEKENTQLSDCITDTVRLWRRHHLTYSQTGYVVKKVRKSLELADDRPKVRIIQRLSQQEVEAIINHAYSITGKYGLMIKTLFFTGLRVNEFVNVRIDHVNLLENEIFVSKGKGDKQRYVPIPTFLKHELTIHIGERRTGYLFESNKHTKFSTRRIQQIVKQVASEVGITRPVYPHLLRKSIATFLLNRGMSIDKVQQLLGHSKLETTQIYAQTSIGSMKEDYQRLVQ